MKAATLPTTSEVIERIVVDIEIVQRRIRLFQAIFEAGDEMSNQGCSLEPLAYGFQGLAGVASDVGEELDRIREAVDSLVKAGAR